MIVGEYTVFTVGNPLRNLRIHRFWVENTQVDCWRIHSFSYRKSLKEIENTQFFGWSIHKLIVGEYTVLHVGNRESRNRESRIENREIENTQFWGGESTS